MNNDPHCPKRITLIPDDYEAKWVGKTSNGSQFFVTRPFVPKRTDQQGCEFIAVILWDENGEFKDAHIDNLGPRENLKNDKAKHIFDSRIKALGKIEVCPIHVSPFIVERFGVEFGLIYKRNKEQVGNIEYAYECVEFHPGNFIALNPPWDGRYET